MHIINFLLIIIITKFFITTVHNSFLHYHVHLFVHSSTHLYSREVESEVRDDLLVSTVTRLSQTTTEHCTEIFTACHKNGSVCKDAMTLHVKRDITEQVAVDQGTQVVR